METRLAPGTGHESTDNQQLDRSFGGNDEPKQKAELSRDRIAPLLVQMFRVNLALDDANEDGAFPAQA
jgi:hypothetical protein